MSAMPVQYEEPVYCDPSFPVVFHEDEMTPERRSIYTNWHTGMEVLWCFEGSGHVLVSSETERFGTGDLVIIGSGELHSIFADTPRCAYYCLIVEPSLLRTAGLDPDAARLRLVVRSEQISAQYKAIVDEMSQTSAHYKPAVIAHILSMFCILYRAHTREGAAAFYTDTLRRRELIETALGYIRAHLAEPITIDELCRHVGVSKYYFCRLFRAYTDLTPIRYINTLRCDYARRLMADNRMNVTEAARAVGVYNLSYFTKMYRRHMGVPPSADASQRDKRDRRGEVMGIR